MKVMSRTYPRPIPITDEAWDELKKVKEESGLTWNQFIKQLLTK